MTLKPTLLTTNPNAQFINNNTIPVQKPAENYAPIQTPVQSIQTAPKNQIDKKKFLIDFLRMFIGISAITLSVHFLSSGKKQNNEIYAAQIEKLSAELEDLRSRTCDDSKIEKLIEKLSKIENSIPETNEITKLAEEVEKLKNREDPTALISKKIDKISKQIEGLQKKQKQLPEIAKDLEAIQQEFNTLKSKANSKSIKMLKKSVTSLERKTNELQTALENAQKVGIQSIGEATANSTTAAVKKISQTATLATENITKIANEQTSAIQQNGEKELSKIGNEAASSISNIETKTKNATTQIKKEKASALKSINKEKEDAVASVKRSAKKVVKTVDDWKERQIKSVKEKTKKIKSGFLHPFSTQKIQQEADSISATPIETPLKTIEKTTTKEISTASTTPTPIEKAIEKTQTAQTKPIAITSAEKSETISQSPVLEIEQNSENPIEKLIKKEEKEITKQIPPSEKINYAENYTPDFIAENFETVAVEPDEKMAQMFSASKIAGNEIETDIPKCEFTTEENAPIPLKTAKKSPFLSLASNQETKAIQQKGLYCTPDGNCVSGYFIKDKNNPKIGINIEKGKIVKSTKSEKSGRKRIYEFIKTYDREHNVLPNGTIEDTTTILRTTSPKATKGKKTVITHQNKGGKEIGEIVRTFDVDFAEKKEMEIKRIVSNPNEVFIYELVNKSGITSENTENTLKYSVKRKQKNGTQAGFEVLPGFRYRLEDVKMNPISEITENGKPPKVLMRTFTIDDDMKNPVYTNGFINALIK